MADPVQTLLSTSRAIRVIPVLRTRIAGLTATAVACMRDAGLSIFAITMTIPYAPALIRDPATDPTRLIGARDRDSAQAAMRPILDQPA